MKKLNKIIILLAILVFSFCISTCYAIDLTLTDPIDDSTVFAPGPSNSTSNTNSDSSDTNSNTNNSTNNTLSNNESNSDNTTYSGNSNNSVPSTNSTNYTTSSSTSTTVSAANSEDSFGISEIINIFIAVIGVILIFLGIAILVKSKNN